MRRPIRKVRPAYRSLTREQELAFTICAAANDAGCACSNNGKAPCSQMTWAAKRAAKFLGVALDGEDRQT